MLIETFTVGMLSTNCYIVSSQKTRDAIIIDPGLDLSSEANPIFEYIALGSLKVKLIVNTHGHPDHIKGDALFQEKYKVPILIHKKDIAALEDLEKGFAIIPIEDKSMIEFGDQSLEVMHTPGHTPGSICLRGDMLIFTGDTLFAQGIGRTDFPEGSVVDMRQSLQKLVVLPDYFLIYPGHGPTSIMGEEKKINPFLNSEAEL
jgi:glyoxylase-like metal-dependent hydrolase (beta-lactamase superfamily II)